jgi:hypothetical protein
MGAKTRPWWRGKRGIRAGRAKGVSTYTLSADAGFLREIGAMQRQMQVLRLRLAQKARQSSLRMTVFYGRGNYFR